MNEVQMKATILGLDKLESVFGTARYNAFSKVFSLCFYEDMELSASGYSILLVLQTDRPRDNYRTHIRFLNVKDLAVKEFGSWPTQITGFDVLDISGAQLEGIRLRITDYENGSIRFLCSAAEVEKVEKIN